MFKVARVILCTLAALSVSSLAQTADVTAGKSGDHPAVPTVTFTLDWPGAEPEHYVLAIGSNSRATYESSGGQRFPGNPYSFKFTVSEATRNRIFDTARALDYFSGNFEYKKRKVAFTGQKTLAYTDASRNLESSYNWSENPKIRQLTELFQGIATTLEFGRSLDYLRRYDKLGLNAELKRMDEMAASGHLAELQVLSAELERIAGDSSVMEIARQKARRLLQRANAGAAAGSQATAQR